MNAMGFNPMTPSTKPSKEFSVMVVGGLSKLIPLCSDHSSEVGFLSLAVSTKTVLKGIWHRVIN